MITVDRRNIIAKPGLAQGRGGPMATVTLTPYDPEFGPQEDCFVLGFSNTERIDQMIDALLCARSMLVCARGGGQ